MSRKKLREVASFLGIGPRIKKIRGGLSQEVFGNLLGVHKSTVSRFESGEIIPDTNIRRKIAEIGNTTENWLLRGEEGRLPQPIKQASEFSEACTIPPLDIGLLAEIMAEVKKFIAGKHVKPSPKQEARLVALIYSCCQEGKVKLEPDLVNRCLWITRMN
jgi:transcriptional regulator with XRE-family HTH domain